VDEVEKNLPAAGLAKQLEHQPTAKERDCSGPIPKLMKKARHQPRADCQNHPL